MVCLRFDHKDNDNKPFELTEREKKVIRYKVQQLNKKGQKTPYRGSSKSFGELYCFKCDNFWTSAHTWKDMGQQCRDCLNVIYPHTQMPLTKSLKKKLPPHETKFCEKCKSIGSNCSLLAATGTDSPRKSPKSKTDKKKKKNKKQIPSEE